MRRAALYYTENDFGVIGMTFNNFLCKHFKPDKEGKVRVGQIAAFVLTAILAVVVLLIIAMFFGSLVLVANEGLGTFDIPQGVVDGDPIPFIAFTVFVGLATSIVVGVMIAILESALKMWEKICSITVATCPIEENDDETKLIEEKGGK